LDDIALPMLTTMGTKRQVYSCNCVCKLPCKTFPIKVVTIYCPSLYCCSTAY